MVEFGVGATPSEFAKISVEFGEWNRIPCVIETTTRPAPDGQQKLPDRDFSDSTVWSVSLDR